MNFQKKAHRALGSSERHDWRTPAVIRDRLVQLGRVALDPCAARDPRHHFASRNFRKADDGLSRSWRLRPGKRPSFVFVNPPYGPAVDDWATKAMIEHSSHGAPIVFLLAARTDRVVAWHARLFPICDAVAFWKGRLRFEGAPYGAPFPSALVYMGPHPERFAYVFRGVAATLFAAPVHAGAA